MSLDVDRIEEDARTRTGLDDTGGDHYREGLERLVASMNEEGTLTEMGEVMQQMRLSTLLAARLGVEETYRLHPEIDDEVIDGPVFVIGLPRTGTTALSQLVAADPQFRSLRTWESAAPVPPPEKATEHTDPRIAATEQGIAMMDEAFPLMQTMHHTEATTATECQDLMGMSFRTAHFDGFARVPSYMAWVVNTDMEETYRYHRRVLRLLQWHCPPRLWHLKTPGPHAGARCVGGGVSERPVPVEPPRPDQGHRIGVQPDPLHPQLEQRPGRLGRTGGRAAEPLVGGGGAGHGVPGPDG